MYPVVELKIKDGIPSVVLYPQEGVERAMTLKSESIIDTALYAAKELDLIDKSAENTQANFEDLLQLARESDETVYIELPDMDVESLEFGLMDTLKPHLEKMTETQTDEYSDLDMPAEIKEELNKFKGGDQFASFMEALYSILIAKTLLAANDLGLGNIALNDDSKNPRLMEKMAKELDGLGIELIIAK